MKKLLALGMGSLALAAGVNAQTLEERVEALEFASYEDIFRFSGQIETRYDSITTEIKDEGSPLTTADDVDDTFHGQFWRNWLRLNMEAKASDRLTFYGRLAAAYYQNRQSSYGGLTIGSSLGEGSSATNAGSEAYFERFFVNYKMTDSTTLTFGRMPTANGTPYHMERNEGMGGAYPFYGYNSLLDGIAISHSFMNNFSAKLVYTPFTFRNEGSSTSKTYAKAEDGTGQEIDILSDVFAVILDYNKSNTSYARAANFTLFYLNLDEETSFALTENGGSENGKQTDLRLGLERFVFAAELNGVAGSKFDFGLQVMQETTKSDGLLNLAASTEVGYLTNEDGDKNTDTQMMLTLRYAVTDATKVGVQYAQAGEHSFVNAGVTRHPVNFYKTPGKGYHLFVNHAFEGGLNATVGYIAHEQDYDATSAIFGEPREVDNKRQNVYTALTANF